MDGRLITTDQIRYREYYAGFAVILLLILIMLGGFVQLAFAGEDFYPEDSNWVVPKHVSLESDAINAFCFGYIKRLRGLWYDIHQKGDPQAVGR